MARRWKLSEIRYLQENYGKLHTRSIAEELGVSVSAVQQKAFKLGLKGRDPNRVDLTTEQTFWLKRNFPHVSNKVCAMILGCGYRTVIRKARHMGLEKTADYIREAQALAAKKAKESHLRNGTYPPKGFKIPRREENYFKKKTND